MECEASKRESKPAELGYHLMYHSSTMGMIVFFCSREIPRQFMDISKQGIFTSWVWQHSMKIFNSSASIVILCYSRVIPCGIVPTLGTWNLELVFFFLRISVSFLLYNLVNSERIVMTCFFFFSTFLGGYYTAIVLWFLNCVVLLQNFGVIKANDTLALTQFHR